MKLAFALYKYFPFGGLQRDMLRIAHACAARGAEVTIFTGEWQGERPAQANIHVRLLPVTGKSNHARNKSFSEAWLAAAATEPFDKRVGFNKLPGLDVYYAADTCFKAKLMEERSILVRWLPRYRQFVRDETHVFGEQASTKILAIAERSVDEYQRYYPTTRVRTVVLPPGINPDRRRPDNHAEIRSRFRREWQVADDEFALLAIGSGFRTKGLDRTLAALAALPEALQTKARLFVIGQDKPDAFAAQAAKLGIAERVVFLAGRDDVPAFLQGVDLLLHPAYRENTGTVLLEAAVAGLPAIASGVCGYAHYLSDYNAGLVIDEPFDQQQYNQALEMLLSAAGLRAAYGEGGLALAEQPEIYSLFERAADEIMGRAV